MSDQNSKGVYDAIHNTQVKPATEEGESVEYLPTEEEAMAAVRVLIRWMGDNPNREGLIDTPNRVLRDLKESSAGYNISSAQILSKTFSEVSEFSGVIQLQGIDFTSRCEHHLLPIVGKVDIAYIPNNRVVGVSKLARLVDVYAKQLQIQERMTCDICKDIDEFLSPKGVYVLVKGEHYCISGRGAKKKSSVMVTEHRTGAFKDMDFNFTNLS